MAWSSDSPVTQLTLVRHGQASYLEGDTYDRLSAVGERQARCLGGYWSRRGISFDYAFAGPAQRHVKTAALAYEAMGGHNPDWPENQVLPEFDEFPGEDVVRTFAPVLAERHPHVRQLADAFESAATKAERKITLDRLFHEVAERWVAGEVSSPDVESWAQFTARVSRGIERIRERVEPGSRVVVFTSAGPTAVTMSLALDISPAKTLSLAFSPRNGSFSEFSRDDAALSLNSFNRYPHLTEPDLLTYR